MFFAYWLCHVPASRFTWFWSWVERALTPTGRVFFIEVRETGIEPGDPHEVAGVGTVTHRRLWDGRSFSLVQNHYEPADLQGRLRGMGWRVAVRAAGTYSLVGYGCRGDPREQRSTKSCRKESAGSGRLPGTRTGDHPPGSYTSADPWLS